MIKLHHPTEIKIQRFLHLAEGWHYGKGGPISEEMIVKAISTHRSIVNILSPNHTMAFPGVGGEIEIIAYRNQHCFEFTLELDNTITLFHSNEDEEIEYCVFLPDELSNKLIGLKSF